MVPSVFLYPGLTVKELCKYNQFCFGAKSLGSSSSGNRGVAINELEDMVFDLWCETGKVVHSDYVLHGLAIRQGRGKELAN